MGAKINNEGTEAGDVARRKSLMVGDLEGKLGMLQGKMKEEEELRAQLEIEVSHSASSKKQIIKGQKQLERELTRVEALIDKAKMTNEDIAVVRGVIKAELAQLRAMLQTPAGHVPAEKRKLTKEELEEREVARSIFNNFDFDESGFISAEELQYLCYDYGYYLSDMDSRVAMEGLDKNGTGRLYYEDFYLWWKNEDRFHNLGLDDKELARRKQVVELWQEMDDNENGVVEKEEFGRFYDAAGKLMPKLKKVKKWDCFEAMDKDGDGIIEFNECIDYLVEMKLLKSSFM